MSLSTQAFLQNGKGFSNDNDDGDNDEDDEDQF